jgi:ribosomal protein S18 acetylase RimI-like enzyme
LFFVAVLGSDLVGTAMAGYDGHRGWIYYVAVSQKYRKRGIGKALMYALEEKLVKMDCPKINLQVRGSNTQAVLFYERLGYEVEDRVSMGKPLQRPGITPDGRS